MINSYYIFYLRPLFWLFSLAAAATEAATPPGRVHKFGSFLSSAPITPSASLRVTGLSDGNFELASYYN